MVPITSSAVLLGLFGLATAQCPFADPNQLAKRDGSSSRQHVAEYDIGSGAGYMTSDAGGPIEDQESLKVGGRGPTLLEDFIFRQKITHFDHERGSISTRAYAMRLTPMQVPERAVHARGAGAYGTFRSYGDYSNVTAASFLASEGKTTPVFVRFSTVAGSRGSADTVRDVHGFATRFYTDEGNFDIVGNNIPVFFIQDAIQFPDLVHAVKPSPDSEIPQAATAHDSAWDFFSQQTSTLHTLFWAMAGYGIPRSYRHMDGFGVHTFRLVTDDGESQFVKWHWKTKQGKASLVWDEAQHIAGKNPDFHRNDLWNAIKSGNGPEWELCAQIFEVEKAHYFGFDVLDPTKIIPEEYVPLKCLGIMKLDQNPVNYFAETEQIMFQPGHIVRGIDFTEDPLLQGRIFSYLDTQLNRHGGPNFEQLPINRPIASVDNNNRDGAGQNFIHRNKAPYFPNTLNRGYPRQANSTHGRGFMTASNRIFCGYLRRVRADSFADHWSQPRLFYNSLKPVEQQFLINAIRFETSQLKSKEIKINVLKQLNKVSHDIAVRVGQALGMEAPDPDPTYYHDNVTAGISIFGNKLSTIATLTVGMLITTNSSRSMNQAKQIKEALAAENVTVSVVGESLTDGVDMTYSAADATNFDAIVYTEDTVNALFDSKKSTLVPVGRPWQILVDSHDWGKPVGFLSRPERAAKRHLLDTRRFVAFVSDDVEKMVDFVKEGLATFKYVERFMLDE